MCSGAPPLRSRLPTAIQEAVASLKRSWRQSARSRSSSQPRPQRSRSASRLQKQASRPKHPQDTHSSAPRPQMRLQASGKTGPESMTSRQGVVLPQAGHAFSLAMGRSMRPLQQRSGAGHTMRCCSRKTPCSIASTAARLGPSAATGHVRLRLAQCRRRWIRLSTLRGGTWPRTFRRFESRQERLSMRVPQPHSPWPGRFATWRRKPNLHSKS